MITPQDLCSSEKSEETYEGFQCFCGCGQAVLNIINPTYTLEVGLENGLPKELVFVPEGLDFNIKPCGDNILSRHFLVTKKVSLFVQCECGEEEEFPLCGYEGEELLALLIDATPLPMHIPVDKIPYVTQPNPEWAIETT